jgi:FG-GAP-like repeat
VRPTLLGGMMMVAGAVAALGQAKPATTTTLTSSSTTLQLPGSLKLTATVAPPAATGGMPTGSVAFFNGTTSLGTGTLAALPPTESFSAPVINKNIGLSPFGLFTLPSGTVPYSVLGMLDWYQPPGSTYYSPEVTIYSGQSAGLFQTSNTTQISVNSGFMYIGSIDAYAIGDFNHDGLPDVLLHGPGGNVKQYYLLPGTAGGGFDPTKPVISLDVAPISCNCDFFALRIITDDFDGDGYPDVGYVATTSGTNTIGVALNAGAGTPGSFPGSGFRSAAAVTDAAGDAFSPTALASGHLTSSGHADLVVAGYFVSPTTGAVVLPGNVAVFQGNGDGTFGTPAVFSGTDGTTPTAVVTADLRGNGITDVVLANEVYTPLTIGVSAATAASNNIQVLLGDGKGGLTTSSTITLPVPPSTLTITDFNNDSYLDILVTGTDGSLNIILNDGTGHFSTTTAIGTTLSIPSLTTSGDFNGDGLADIAEITNRPISNTATTSTASELLNSASSQAVLNTPRQTLPAGTDTLTANFPGDNNFAASTSTGVAITVTQTVPTITWPNPQAIQYGTALSAMQLNASANVPGSFTYNPAAGTVLPVGQTTVTAIFAPTDSFDYSGAVATQTITVIASPATATATAPATTETAQTASASLTVNPYPVPITATLSLSFTPAPPNTVADPGVVFPNNGVTQVIQIPANSTTNQSINFSTGSTAGTITLTIVLTASGANVTPETLVPLNISVPASPPVITSATLTRNGKTMTVAIRGLSSTRDMSQARFHFAPAAGKSLKTTDLTLDLSSPFSSWYGSSTSASYGTTFLYTQPFTLDSDATTVGNVAVTLANSRGDSQPRTAQ